MPLSKLETSLKDVSDAIEEITDHPDYEEILDLANSNTRLLEDASIAARRLCSLIDEATCNYSDQADDEDPDDEEEADDE